MAILHYLVNKAMRALFGGIAYGAGAYLFMQLAEVRHALPIAILVGAVFAWLTTEE